MKWNKTKNFELRKTIRLPVSLSVKFRLFDIETRQLSPNTINGQLRNISIDGLCLETNTALVDNRNIFVGCLQGKKLLQVEVKLPDTHIPLRLRGEVVWFNSQPPGSTYRFFAGIKIIESAKQDRNIWKEYVEEHKGRWSKVWTKLFFKNK